MKKEEKNLAEKELIRHRTITLKDGRYMIFYTFADTLSAEQPKPETKAKPEGPEKKNV
jgi:predicted transcriptional regulator